MSNYSEMKASILAIALGLLALSVPSNTLKFPAKASKRLISRKQNTFDDGIGLTLYSTPQIPQGGSITPPTPALHREFLQIALPALIQLTAEPLASLVDTYYLSMLGPTVLGGAGVAITGGYALGKIVGDPVLRCCISLVASSSGDERKLSINVTVALLLALTIGVAQGAFYLFNSKNILLGLGVPSTSPMYPPAFAYMMVRGFALPASMLWLVVNGVYRGIGDTVTPLVWSCVFTLLNVVLDPVFMFRFGMGSAGAALGTVSREGVECRSSERRLEPIQCNSSEQCSLASPPLSLPLLPPSALCRRWHSTWHSCPSFTKCRRR